jgi:hypothetical protein
MQIGAVLALGTGMLHVQPAEKCQLNTYLNPASEAMLQHCDAVPG